MIDFFNDNKSCSTNGADVIEEGIVRYYFKKRFEKEIQNKLSSDLKDSFTLSMVQFI